VTAAAHTPGPTGRCAGEVLDGPAHVLFGAGRVTDAQQDGVAVGRAGRGDQRGAGAEAARQKVCTVIHTWPAPVLQDAASGVTGTRSRFARVRGG
jgi:hypothetical protein